MNTQSKPTFSILVALLLIVFTAKAQIFTPELTSEDRTDTRIDGPLNLYGKLSTTNRLDVQLNATSWGVSAPDSKDNHLRLRSNDTGNSLDYIGMQFMMSDKYWFMMRVNGFGFHFTDGDSFSYKKIFASGFQQSSDLTLKTNIQTLTNPLDKIDSLRGVSFNWTETGEPSIGFVAQEVQEVLPELVQGMEGSMSVEYSNIIAVAVEAIKALKSENEALRSQSEALELKSTELESRLATLEALIAEMNGN